MSLAKEMFERATKIPFQAEENIYKDIITDIKYRANQGYTDTKYLACDIEPFIEYLSKKLIHDGFTIIPNDEKWTKLHISWNNPK